MLGYQIDPTKIILKKVEHICLKSVKIELTRNQKRRNKYALQIFYRKALRIARC